MSDGLAAAPGGGRVADGPVRPSISPMLWAGAAAWVGSLLGAELALWTASGAVPLGAALGWAVTATAAVIAAALRRTRWLLPAAAITLGVCASLLHGAWISGVAQRADACGPREWTGVVAADPTSGATGTRVLVRITDPAASGALASLSWPDEESPPPYGASLRFSTRLAPVDLTQDWAQAAFRRGEALSGSPWRVEREGWAPPPLGPVAQWRAENLARLDAIGGEGADVLRSMLFGDRSATTGSPAEEDARSAGVAWALSASGLHLAVSVLLAERLAGLLGMRRRGRAVAAVAVVGLIAAAAGLRVALVRAALVASAAALGRLAGRRRDGTAATGIVVLLLVVLDPPAAWDVGLLLGVLAVVGITVFGPLARAWLQPLLGRGCARAIGSSAAAQAAVVPVSAAMFGAVGLLGPFALALSVPLVQSAVAAGLTGALAAPVWEAGGTALLRLAALAASGAVAVWRAVARLPGAVVPVAAVPWWAWCAWALAASLAWARWPLPRRAARVRAAGIAIAVVLAAIVLAPLPSGPGIVVLDVGQGDAILVRDGAHALLVDMGPDPAVLRRGLARAQVRALDGVVLTHAHADHVGGLPGLAGVARPDWIGVPDVADAAVDRLAAGCARRAGKVVRLKRDMTWTVGETSVRVLWPCGGERGLEANDTSVILLLERRGEVALLLGDAEEHAQRGALKAFAQKVDVVKVAHHGSSNGSVPEALEVWKPSVALISVGDGNPFGHPHRSALEALASIGASVRRTDREGDLCVLLDGAAAALAASPSGAGVCDNRGDPMRSARACLRARHDEASTWPPETLTTSNPSISSTARRSCCSTARSSGCGSASPRSRTSTSTSRRSRATRAPPTMWSTRRTPCRS